MTTNRRYYSFIFLYLGLLLVLTLAGGVTVVKWKELVYQFKPTLYDLPRMEVAVGTSAQENVTARLTLQLHLLNRDIPKLSYYEPLIADRINSYMANLSVAELRSPRTANWLRRELYLQIRQVSGPLNIREVSIKNFSVL